MSGGKVYLTGGGCGDAGLVTLKAIKALQSCDTVVYDSLVSEQLLQWTRPDCERIYVGKRYHCHSRKQDEINTLLVEKAREGKTVVRLKGGDPYVFGRGGEEFMALRDADICCEVIPGITSAIAVPASAGIPVTHRGLSDSVTVVTGTAAKTGGHTELRLDFPILAQLKGTLVILMGMHHLAEIVAGLLAAGKDRNTPCAIIMEGTTERQRVLRAPLFELSDKAAGQGVTSPAVIVVGAVAGLELMAEKEAEGAGSSWAAAESTWTAHIETGEPEAVKPSVLPLAGISVGVTGTAHFADRLSLTLREKGADIRDMSFMEIQPAQGPLPDLTDYGWLVFTSPNGVHVFLDKMRQSQCDLRTLSDKKIAVIGPGTAAALREAGIYADYMPEVYDAIHLAEGLANRMTQERTDDGSGSAEGFLEEAAQSKGEDGSSRRLDEARRPAIFLRAKQGSDVLPRIFRGRGFPFTEYALYGLCVREEKRDAVIRKEPDYIVFGSAMGARAYFEGLERTGIRNTKSRYVCIGEWCAKEVRKYVAEPPLIPEESSVDAIAECLCRLGG
ncbi:MAG: uroporphyrinogen-III C-methyltransferase [Lachnospiraceae bacterium]|nr:uroporphyrinogen-III C-methyltransferase [Lachnospiraceae bacterium]